jgi:hypothetical protein
LALDKIDLPWGSDYAGYEKLIVDDLSHVKVHNAWNYSVPPEVKGLRFCVRCAFLTQNYSDFVALGNTGCI